MYENLLTISDAAKMLGISPSTLRRLEKNGQVKNYGIQVVYTPGGQRRYMMDELQNVYSKKGFSGSLGFGKKPMILIRDVVHAFIDEGSSLSIKTTFDLQNLTQFLNIAQDLNIPIAMTRTIYNPESEFSKLWGKKFPYLKMLEADSIWINTHTSLQNINFVIDNKTPYVSDLYQSDLVEYINKHQIDTLILIGATTSGSIRATAVDAFQHALHIIIPKELVGDRTHSLQESTLLDINARYADVLSTLTIQEHLRNSFSY